MTDNRLDAHIRLVSDRQRRRVIRRLRETADDETTVDSLVDELHSTEPIQADGGAMERSELSIQLRHTHLPKLASHGVVDYDQESGTLSYLSHEQVEAVLDALPTQLAHAEL
ncbi:DUF7344 domain-containing protein [Halobacterium wangiae]|uniref:DUF7344 domain-containing protein n=1 Tax=Halobacterium wangiae TaxID=2902623 RepID=UPI001E44A162|nr:ArsR family transcriptional regulator [Halobacterium wangiae]